MRGLRIALIVVAVVCFGVALSYPIRYRMKQNSNNASLDELAAMRRQAQTEAGETAGPTGADKVTEAPEVSLPVAEATEAPEVGLPVAETTEAPEVGLPVAEATEAPEVGLPVAEATEDPEVGPPVAEATEVPEISLPVAEVTEAPETGLPVAEVTEAPEIGLPVAEVTEAPIPAPTRAPGVTPGFDDLRMDFDPHARAARTPVPTVEPTPTPEPTPVPTYDGPLPYPMKEKVEFDESAILPELRDIYELNHDLIGWLTIPGTVIDYPVVQVEDSQYYLEHDFYGNSNMNGQIILDSNCDPYTPSYNLVISGHHMQNGSMFGDLPEYRNKNYWEKRKFVEFDTLMARKQYVIFAVFYSADYDEDEEGFRYNADVRYRLDTRHWLEEIEENKLYDTGIDVAFGDEFITLTTCNRVLHKNGRFVVVCRRIREGETFE